MDVSADILLRDDKSIDILEILKTAVRDFDQGIIALGSSRSYKSSNHLYMNSEHYIKVPRESTYGAFAIEREETPKKIKIELMSNLNLF